MPHTPQRTPNRHQAEPMHAWMELRPRRLYSQLASLFALLFALAVGLLSIYAGERQASAAAIRLLSEAQAFTRSLATAIAPSVTSANHPPIFRTLEQAAFFPGLRSIQLVNADGTVELGMRLNASGRPVVITARSHVRLPPALAPTAAELAAVRSISGSTETEFEVLAALPVDAPRTWLLARFSASGVAATRQSIIYRSALAGLAAAVLAMLAVFLFLRKPMARLNEARIFAEHLEYSYGDTLSTDSGIADIDALTHALNKTSIRLYEQQVALARSEAHFRAVVEDLSELVFETDAVPRWTYLNPAWTDITQYDIDEGLGRRVLDFAPEDEHPRITEAFRLLRRGEAQQARGQFRYRAKDGSIRWLEVQARARRSDANIFLGFIGSVTDITSRKQAESALLDQLAFMEALIEAIPNPIYLKDLDGRYLAFNRAFEKQFSIKRQDWLGKTEFDLIADSKVASLLYERDQILLNDGGMQSFELSVPMPDGQPVDMLFQKSLFFRADHIAAGILGCMADISLRKQYEQELMRAKEAAEAANKAKSEFLANVSHEIRTPLNAIIGMTQLTLDTELAREQEEYLALVLRSANSLLAIINDILDFSKIEAGHMRFEHILFNIHECVEATIRTMASRAREKKIALDFSLAPEIPENVMGDPHRLQQILLNLIGNALKFTCEGEIYVAVEILKDEEDGVLLRFAVSDTGVGIEESKQELIFQAFSQADSTITRRFGGTGLGLTICAHMVQLMDGKIWVESEENQGSTFYFTAHFCIEGESGDEDGSSSERAPLRFSPATRPLKLLLAEDNQINQIIATKILNKAGHSVSLANNGAEALAMQMHTPFDAILMDIQMPIMSGLEATEAIRRYEAEHKRAKMPIIAMTAHAMQGDKEICLAAGMDGYVTKPIMTDVLTTELIAAIHGHAGTSVGKKKRRQRKGKGVFDKQWMLEQIGGDIALMHEVARIFIDDSARICEALQTQLAEQDWPRLTASAHTAKGAASNFGSSTTVAAALALENAARVPKTDEIPALCAQLVNEMQRLVGALQRELDSAS